MKSIGDGEGFVIRPITNGTRIAAFMISRLLKIKDYWTGQMLIGFCAAAMIISRNSGIGRAAHTGLGFFPTYRLSLFHFTDRYALTCKFPFFYSSTVQRQCLIN